ncbi:MAG: methionine--tRNA ligase [Eubacteriales bacterium]|nr:methionine--tRNA ligase [Eubacteriales bacterium]
MSKEDKFYITTPIYYPSGKWHIGTCYTTVICDAIARYKRMQNKDVFYLTGTDEHGQKIETTAKEHGITPKEWVDKQVESLKKLWEIYDISYNRFIRTTDADHEKLASKIFDKLYEKGEIYKSEYEGWYCVPCESFWTKSQLVDGKCPDCGREVTLTKESSYFFKLSKYQDKILKLFEEHPEFLEPKSRQNEMINNFLKPGLKDLAVSRTSFKWGIPVSFDKDHVMYVWIDALTNYITALGYGSDDDSLFKRYWPADIHMMAKEIVRFHSIIWPAILMALDIELPKKVYGHGWLLFDGGKMSKSTGNVVDPFLLADKFGADAIRYYLLRDVPFGQDGIYTNELLLKRINSDLVNTLGNLVKRTSAMIEQYFGGVIPAPCKKEAVDDELIKTFVDLPKQVEAEMDKYDTSKALNAIFDALSRANKYIDETTPWVLNKEGNVDRLKTVMYNLSEAIRFATVLLTPFLTKTPDKIYASFPFDKKLRELDSLKEFGAKIDGVKVEQKDAIFNRIDIPKTLKEMEEIAAKTKKEAAAKKEEKKENIEGVMDISQIAIDDFAKVDLRVGQILTAEKVEGADKLLKFSVKVGEEERTIVSGIAKHYTPDELIGKEVIVVANLKPAKLRGIMSEGMLLCAVDGDKVVLITPMANVNSGSKVC